MTVPKNRSLEEERDLLLRSLDDLDAEHAAGDLDDADYEALRDSYIARAAMVVRQLDGEQIAAPAAEPGRRGLTRLAVLAVLAVFAVGAGLVLARTVGERGVNDEITGGIEASSRRQVVTCQELGSTGGDLVAALECFDDVLATDPDNAEALSYRGWYLLLAAGSLQEATSQDDPDAAELIATGLTYLDRAIEVDPDLPDPLAFRATVNDRLGRSDEVCTDLAVLQTLDPPQFFLDQTAPLVTSNNC